ncbi:MAG: hypothetical protein AAB603_03855 [Patescibacteria group bacterium]
MTTSDKQRVTLFLIPALLTHARAQAVVEGRTLTDLVERALVKYLPKKTVIKKVKIKSSIDS